MTLINRPATICKQRRIGFGSSCGAAMLLTMSILTNGNAASPTYETTEVGEGVYQFRYQSHNTMFVVTGDGVVAFDPISPTAAADYAGEIKRVAPRQPLLAVIYSHHDEDHASGAPVLQEAFSTKAPIVAHRNARPHLVRKSNPDVPAPNFMFDERMDLDFGNRAIELHYLGRSHTDSMLVALVPDARIAFVVDFASQDGVGFRDLPRFYFPDQFRSLERLAALDFDTIIFGHGPNGDKASVKRQQGYYRALWAAVEESCRAGASADQAAASIVLPAYAHWRGYDDWFTLNVRGVYRWVAKDSPCG